VPVHVPVTTLVRMSRSPAREPFWSKAKRYRFDDPQGRFGVLYAGDSIETSFAESVIHERAVFRKGAYMLELGDFVARQPVWYAGSKNELKLADLTGAHLKALGLNNDISAGDGYAESQRWSRAIYQADPDWDGIRFVSRQHNRQHAFAVFERAALVKRKSRRLTKREQNALSEAFNVVLI
jgi:hypothetical protein